jgi:hypothetical protein
MQDRLLTKEEFLEKLKTDSAFNSRYGRKHITEGKMVLPPCHYGFQVYTRELSFEERKELMVKYTNDNSLLPIGFSVPFGEESNKKYLEVCDSYSIPTRLITITYNDKIIESYE